MRDFAVDDARAARQRQLPPLRRTASRRGGVERGGGARARPDARRPGASRSSAASGYRGYFDRADADAWPTKLRAQGLEVNVYGVPAYSTLGRLPGGYFADPLLSTFINYPEVELARMMFHELSHQVAFASGDTMFNESFATAVERIGSKRWMTERASPRPSPNTSRSTPGGRTFARSPRAPARHSRRCTRARRAMPTSAPARRC